MDTPKPGDFPIGSVESRAAMRLQLSNKTDARPRMDLVFHMQRPWHGEGPQPENWNDLPSFGPWQDCGDRLMRLVYVPHVWLKPGESIPACPDCGLPFEKTSEYPGMVGYAAACPKSHDPCRACGD